MTIATAAAMTMTTMTKIIIIIIKYTFLFYNMVITSHADTNYRKNKMLEEQHGKVSEKV